MLRRILSIAVVLALSVSADVAVLQSYFTNQQTSDTTIFAANVFTQDTQRLIHEASVAMGTQDIQNNFPNFMDTSARINTLSELFVAASILKLVEETVLPSIDTAIPTRYLPRGVSFFNPATPGTLLTLRQLLTHTSTISDAKFENAGFKTTSPTAVPTLRAFIEGYFLQSSGGTYSVASDVWFSGTPGAAASYRYARVNVALLAFIIEQVVVERPTLVATGSQQTVGAYIQEKILNPLGMSATYLRNLDGSFPSLTYPSGSPLFSNKAVKDYTSAGTLATTTTLHAAYPADYMYYSTVTDISRLMRSLFLDTNGAMVTVGRTMKDAPFTVSGTNVRLGVKQQGQGLMFFAGDVMCAAATATAVISKCPLLSTSVVWGHVTVGSQSQYGTFCTDTASSVNPTCVTASISFYDTGSSFKSLNIILGMAAVAFQEAIGDKSTVTQVTTSDDTSTRLYPLWVAMGIAGVVLFVFVASFVTENLIQQAPVSAGVPVPTAVPRY